MESSDPVNNRNCLVHQPKRVPILVWQRIAPHYRQRGILGLHVGGIKGAKSDRDRDLPCPDIPRSR